MLQWLRPSRRVSRVYKLFEAQLNQLMASAPPGGVAELQAFRSSSQSINGFGPPGGVAELQALGA